jgi:hypothetical protein
VLIFVVVSCDQPRERQSLANCQLEQRIETTKRVTLYVAVVQTKGKFVDVLRQMLGVSTLIGIPNHSISSFAISKLIAHTQGLPRQGDRLLIRSQVFWYSSTLRPRRARPYSLSTAAVRSALW